MLHDDIGTNLGMANGDGSEVAELLRSLHSRLDRLEGESSDPYHDYVRVAAPSSQNIPTHTWTKLTGFTSTTDLIPEYSTADANAASGDIEVQRSRPIIMSTYMSWGNESDDWAGSRSVRFVQSPGPAYMGVTEFVATTGNTAVSHTWLQFVNASFDISVEVYQTSGVTTTVSGAVISVASV